VGVAALQTTRRLSVIHIFFVLQNFLALAASNYYDSNLIHR
jgi:hypothetical protein